MSTIYSWLPTPDESGNFKKESGWNVILKQIYMVLMTPKNSRQWQPDFGSRIHEYLFEHTDNKDAIESEVRSSFAWLPHVKLVAVSVTVDMDTGRGGAVARVDITVEWNNEQLPVGIVIPSNLDDLDGSIYNIGLKQTS